MAALRGEAGRPLVGRRPGRRRSRPPSCRSTCGGGTACPSCASSATARATSSARSARRGRDPAAAAAVAAAIDAIPLRRFVLLAEHVAGDQGFGALTGARPLYRESSPVLRFEHADLGRVPARSGGATSASRRAASRASSASSERCPTASPPTPTGSQRDLDTLFRAAPRAMGRRRDALPAGVSLPSRVRRAGARAGVAAAVVPRDRRASPSPRCTASGSPAPSRRTRPAGIPRSATSRSGSCCSRTRCGEALADGMGEFRLLRGGAAYKDRFATDDPGLETYGLAARRLGAGAALRPPSPRAAGRSGLRRILDRF